MQTKGFINGCWVDAISAKTFPVTNPATGQEIAQVANMHTEDCLAAITAAHNALPSWRAKTARERSQKLKAWFSLILEHAESLAALMTAEQGKPLAEARGEVIYGASFVEWFAEEAKRVYGDVIPSTLNDRKLFVFKEPIGVVAAITPWNFPMAMITRKCAPAIAAGCTVIIKPAEATPLTALALADLAHQAGIPAGVFNVVVGDAQAAPAIGLTMCTDPRVRKISFTGSTEVGRILLKQSADTVKKLSLELGGNAPFLVFDDADIDAAVEGAMASKYRNAGQTCVCANRIYVQDAVYDEFAQKLAAKAGQLRVGPGTQAGVQIGPLIEAAALEKVKAHVADAVSGGAKILVGGKPHSLGGLFFEPTVITGVTSSMQVAREETFGPVAPLFRFKTEAEAIAMANDTEFGLAAYFYARDVGRIFRVAEALEAGIVSVNAGNFSNEVAPFGGVKQSGLGREGSKYGIEEFLEIKYLTVAGLGAYLR
jgi:succinate-semialdehyde dehydrogenase / glutarate-semialdehyde dehydrogenase